LTLSFRHFGIKLCLLLLQLLNYLLGNGKFRFRTFNLLGERLGELTHLLLQVLQLCVFGCELCLCGRQLAVEVLLVRQQGLVQAAQELPLLSHLGQAGVELRQLVL